MGGLGQFKRARGCGLGLRSTLGAGGRLGGRAISVSGSLATDSNSTRAEAGSWVLIVRIRNSHSNDTDQHSALVRLGVAYGTEVAISRLL